MRRIWAGCALAIAIGVAQSTHAITGDRPDFRKLAGDVYAYVGKLNDANAMAIEVAERRLTGVVSKAVQDGRFVTVTTSDGQDVLLRVTADTDVEGVTDRTRVRPGMKVSALYQVPEGVVPSLGYDALEFAIVP